ncbi:MAG: hypothetical protein R3F61_09220 [Myxococcota bacterium]
MFGSILLSVMGCNDYALVEKPDVIIEDTDEPVVPPPTPPAPADAPVADCSVSPNPVAPPFEAATFDGSGSYDPNGLAITDYNWELSEKPQGSAATMPGGGAVRSGFMADQAGLYVGRLVVTNEAGVQSPACEAELEAIPAQNLWVEMYWTLAGDDMDLHLLAPGGTPTSDLDCYYVNCNESQGDVLDWGVPGVSADNPRLDLDDIWGTGPENINIDNPDGSNGGFTVVVHDFGGGNPGANDVTVNIYLNGQLAWTQTRTLTGDLDYHNFAQIDWNNGTVTGL